MDSMTLAGKIFRILSDACMYILGSRMAAHNLKHLADRCANDVEQLTSLSFSFKYPRKFPESWSVIIRPIQVKSEITALCRIVQKLNPKVVVELGTAAGGTLFLISQAANPQRIISVDLPGGSFGGCYPSGWIPFLKSFAKKNVIRLIRADSHDAETLAKIQSVLEGNEVDFLFIDGDHTYQGVKQDFKMYSPLVRTGGIVAFHDIVPGSIADVGGVHRFWIEIRDNYQYSEIVADWNQSGFGIGLLYF